MNAITSWIEAHPVVFNSLIWPLVSALVLLVFKPRSPEQYAKLPPRVAGFMIVLSGLGLDIPKALEGLKRVLTGKSLTVNEAQARDLLEKSSLKPPPPDGGTTGAVLLIVGAGFVFSQTSACSLFTSKNARTVLDLVEVACIIAHQELPESQVATVCGVADDLIPPMRRVLAESRKASAEAATKAGAAKCVEK